MNVKKEIERLEQKAKDVVAAAKLEADAIIESAADNGTGLWDDAAQIVAEAEAEAANLRDEAKALAEKYLDAIDDAKDVVLDVVGDVKEDVEELVDDAKGFFEKYKVYVLVAAAVLVTVLGVIGILI